LSLAFETQAHFGRRAAAARELAMRLRDSSLDADKRPQTRRRSRGIFALGFALLGAGACSTSGQVAHVGAEDHARAGQIEIDENAVTASIADGTLRVDIPITASETTTGRMQAGVIDLQGRQMSAASPVNYDLTKGAKTTVHVELRAPEGIQQQADLVKWNLRIDDGTASGLRITRSLLEVVSPYEVRLEGPSTVATGKSTSYRVLARNTRTGAPVEGIPLQLTVSKDGTTPRVFTGISSATGDAVFPVSADDAGDYQVSAGATVLPLTATTVTDTVKVQTAGAKLLLTSDKPIYQPGQVLHLRALALSPGGDQPIAGTDARFEIEDGKGNRIFKKPVTTDSFGVAATTFTLGTMVNQGTFKLRVVLGDTKSEKTVTVSPYTLPKFDVALGTDKPWYRPGEIIAGTIDARYFFGKTVSGGDVSLEASTLDVGQTLFQKVLGKLDAQGHYQFSVQLPSVLTGTPLQQGKGTADLHVTVTDTAGQQAQKDIAVVVSSSGLQIALVPESTGIVPGVDNDMLLFVDDPLGAPVANAAVQVHTPDGTASMLNTDAFGQADFHWTATADASTTMFGVNVSLPGAPPASQEFTFQTQSGKQHLVVRTDKALYQLGDTVQVDLQTTDDERSIYVDWLNGGQTVDMRTLQPEHGVAHFSMNVDNTLKGSNQIEAYVVDDDGNVVRAGRTIFARGDGSLVVSMSTDQPTYAPGQPAKLTFSVEDETGRPAVAALGVQIVDQAVFSLIDARPGLLKSFFELEDTYAKPQYEIAGPSVDLGQLLFQNPADPNAAQAGQQLSRATFAALGNRSVTGIEHSSWTDVIAAVSAVLAPSYDGARASLLSALRSQSSNAIDDLDRESCTPDLYYCTSESSTFSEALLRRVATRISAFDFWGNVYRVSVTYGVLTLTSSGPDELAGTADDHPFAFQYSEIDTSQHGGIFDGANAGIPGAGTGAGGAAIAGPGGAVAGGAGSAGTTAPPAVSGDAPRVRQDFPETLYVNPSVITGSDGKASIDLTMADSITQWRVSTLANASDGRLGGGEAGVTVFQDFFVDINFPPTLTRGDQVEFPIALYNYLSTPQTVRLDLQADTWFTPLGAVTKTIDLAPGQVTGTSFPVRVDQGGLRTLTVKAQGTSKADAVARSVHVVPDGKLVSDVSSGMLAAGTTSHTFTFADGAVPGSGQLYVEVYPAFLSQVVSGMDNMLREPSGCFEQTTSTTWPNVLATAYMQKTNQITPEIELKAESLISTGYQRLLTFEHPGGGFSWFGTQDPAPFLSVTAFGLMEFADMQRVADVDQAMIDRTQNWLVAQQQDDGSWKGDMSEFFTFHTSAVRNTSFVVWALANNGYTGSALDRGVAFIKSSLATASSQDDYTLAMAANALALVAPGDPVTAQIMASLAASAKSDGSWDSGGTQTCFYGSGNDAAVTTTALALNALLLDGQNNDVTQGALKFLTASKDPNGNFGSTQATVWTLRALLLAASKGNKGAVGVLDVSVDGTSAETLNITEDQSDVVTTVDLSTLATAGSHALTLAFQGTGQVSFNAVAKYNMPWAQTSDPPGPLSIAVSYDKTQLYVNDTVHATVRVQNNTASTENMVLVTVGVPPGFAVQTGDLDAYLANHALSKYELTGTQLTLYLTQIPGNASLSFSYGLQATMPVKASDGGGEAKLYYEPTQKAHAPAVTLQALAE
jgi:uncharacterized protein YfaS (alpha-2-macroglobulin family)